MKKFKPKLNEKVSVCYDGKTGRMVEGRVLSIKGFMILVQFKEWASENEKEITCWFPRKNDFSYGRFVPVEDSLMKKLFGAKGDWYSVYRFFKTN